MVASNFAAALAFAWRPENDGGGDHVDANDPGGETNKGVTIATWNAAVDQGYVTGALRDATDDDLAKILRIKYWRACSCDMLTRGVDLLVFDMAMVSGPGRSAMILQTALGFTGRDVDGDVGANTLRMATRADPFALINMLTTDDEAFYGSLRAFHYFGRGWDRRAEDAKAAALMLLGA